MAWLYSLSKCVRPVLQRVLHAEVTGTRYIPAAGPVLIAANHGSFADPWLIGMLVPRRDYRYLIARSWFERSSVWKAVFRAWGTIPTSPGRIGDTLMSVKNSLNAGEAVVVFPEGRISHDGTIGRGKPGIALFAEKSGVPVVPLGLQGTFQFLPRTRRWPTWHPVTVQFGPPIPFPQGVEDNPESLSRYTEQVMTEIRRLAGQPPSRSAR